MAAHRAVIPVIALAIATLAGPALAQLRFDPGLGQSIDLPPELEVTVPSDRTDFSPVETPVDIPLPDMPPLDVIVPDDVTPQFKPYVPQIVVTPAPTPDKPTAIVRQPVPISPPAYLQKPVPAPEPGVAMVPDKPTAPPVAAPVAPPAIPPSSVPVAGSVALDSVALDAVIEQIGRLQPLPNGLLRSVRGFYASRDGALVWTDAGKLTPRAVKLLTLIDHAADHGLDPRRFASLGDSARTATGGLRDVALSTLAALYAHDARGGRIQPMQISRLITATPPLPDPVAVLEGLRIAPDAAATLEAYHPRHGGYHALKAALATARSAPASAPAYRLAHGPVLVRGMSDPRVPALREILALPPAADTIYDAALSTAVREAQRTQGLRATGRLDARTVAALGGPPVNETDTGKTIGDIIANMERWRWLPVDLGTDHVFVNVPSFALTFQQNGQRVLQTRVVVGKPESQTPIFSDRMQFLVINPYWNVPPSIALKELLPLLQKNPYALQARGLEVVSRGRVVDPSTVDWNGVGRSVAIRQPPGERNALGHIKFMFPNQHAVYLHDTPSRALFQRDVRAFSHGCVRVQNPFQLAETLLGAGWSEARLKSMIGGPERQVKLDREIPVHLAYFTTFVDETGNLITFPDLYGHHRRLKSLLGV